MEKSITQCDVLVIEDEQTLSELVRINLISRNISTIVAETGLEGISLALRRHPRVILLDIVLPDIDGWQICRFFKNNNLLKSPAIVFMTASTQKKDKEDASG
ncbi:MAG: response regulator [Fibrobacter sp.]|nr:response regulator [Fibrobacter sp.]